jgi:hypothetical protein
MWISTDPTWIRVYMLLLCCGGFTLLWLFMRRFMNHEFAAFAILGLMASSFSYEASRQLWHSSLLPIPIAGFLLSSARLLLNQGKPTKYACIAGLCAAIAVQLHLCAVVYVALFGGLLIVRGGWLKAQGIACAVVVFLVALLPMGLGVLSALMDGAFGRSSGAMGGWSPAGVEQVFSFFVDNVHILWGDTLGPLLTWPFIILMGVGSVRALVRGGPLQRLLVANLILGFGVESLLLGNQWAFRYMHANLFAAFGLAGLGTSFLMGSIKVPIRQGVLALIALVVITEAALSPVPHSHSAGWLNTNEQKAVAALLAEHFPMDEDTMETHIHGIYFGESMGLGYLHSRLDTKAGAGEKKAKHILVRTSDLKLAPLPSKVTKSRSLIANNRRITASSFVSLLDHSTLKVQGPNAGTLMNKWRRARWKSHSFATHSIVVSVRGAGRIHLALGRRRQSRLDCPFTATLNGNELAATKAHTVPYPGLSIWSLRAPKKGRLKIRLGPCVTPRFVDLW